MENRIFKCYDCKHKWEVPYGVDRPSKCPKCKSTNFHRAEEDRGHSRSGLRKGKRLRHGQRCN